MDYDEFSIEELSCLSRELKALGIMIKKVSTLKKLIGIHGINIRLLGLYKLNGETSVTLTVPESTLILNITDCSELEFSSVNEPQCYGNHLLRLEILTFWNLPRLEKISMGHLENLRVLTVGKTYQLIDLSCILKLPYLEQLYVSCCNKMKQLVNIKNNIIVEVREADLGFSKAQCSSLIYCDQDNAPKQEVAARTCIFFPERWEARSADSSNAITEWSSEEALLSRSSQVGLLEPSSGHTVGSVDIIWSKKSSCPPPLPPTPWISRSPGCNLSLRWLLASRRERMEEGEGEVANGGEANGGEREMCVTSGALTSGGAPVGRVTPGSLAGGGAGGAPEVRPERRGRPGEAKFTQSGGVWGSAVEAPSIIESLSTDTGTYHGMLTDTGTQQTLSLLSACQTFGEVFSLSLVESSSSAIGVAFFALAFASHLPTATSPPPTSLPSLYSPSIQPREQSQARRISLLGELSGGGDPDRAAMSLDELPQKVRSRMRSRSVGPGFGRVWGGVSAAGHSNCAQFGRNLCGGASCVLRGCFESISCSGF
ncbi:hypothetical protein GUJ93_ZPchr0007g3538 [Zizania palustris]|uniref:Uncharacterized protein n=1 Tax=Zizania palustris TaxID=103762 RepID=A0A8J5SRZ1_ZIZPA|nr:hypothetical protein GUJ93_ZPchr0007g3538 [Zizania palustris]